MKQNASYFPSPAFPCVWIFNALASYISSGLPSHRPRMHPPHIHASPTGRSHRGTRGQPKTTWPGGLESFEFRKKKSNPPNGSWKLSFDSWKMEMEVGNGSWPTKTTFRGVGPFFLILGNGSWKWKNNSTRSWEVGNDLQNKLPGKVPLLRRTFPST